MKLEGLGPHSGPTTYCGPVLSPTVVQPCGCRAEVFMSVEMGLNICSSPSQQCHPGQRSLTGFLIYKIGWVVGRQ